MVVKVKFLIIPELLFLGLFIKGVCGRTPLSTHRPLVFDHAISTDSIFWAINTLGVLTRTYPLMAKLEILTSAEQTIFNSPLNFSPDEQREALPSKHCTNS